LKNQGVKIGSTKKFAEQLSQLNYLQTIPGPSSYDVKTDVVKKNAPITLIRPKSALNILKEKFIMPGPGQYSIQKPFGLDAAKTVFAVASKND